MKVNKIKTLLDRLRINLDKNQLLFDQILKPCSHKFSGIPEAETFGRKGKFSALGFRFRPPKLKAECGRNFRNALDFFFPSVFPDENIMAWFS